jgi:GGDEF domain-containing protein
VVCEHVSQEAALRIGRRVEEALRAPIAVGESSHELSASIGIGLGRSEPETLLSAADAAAYRAKAAGGARVALFDSASHHPSDP